MDEMSEERGVLLPCPFCGHAVRMERKENAVVECFQVQCHGCGARGDWKHREEAALAAWNRRILVFTADQEDLARPAATDERSGWLGC